MKIKNYFLFVLIAGIGFGCQKESSPIPNGNASNSGPVSSKDKFKLSSTGSTYYVSPSGNDANNGTSPSAPWKTISKVNSQTYSPGDQILFQGGQTFAGNIIASSSGSSSSYVRYASYGTGRASINAGTGTGVYVLNKSYVLVDSLIIYGGFNATSQSGNNGYGVEFLNNLTGGVILGYCKVINCDVSGFKLAGIQFLGAPSDNSQSGFSQIIAYFNNVRDNAIAGISSIGGYPPSAGSTSYSFPYVYVGYNYVYNNLGYKPGNGNHTGDGIVIGDASSGTIEHNVAYNNGWNNTNSGGGPAAIWCWDSTNLYIQYNEAYNNGSNAIDGDGFDLDGGATYCTMQYNYSHDNAGAGYLIWEFGDSRVNNSHNTIRYNISKNDGARNGYGSIEIGASANNCNNNYIYNNTCFNSGPCVKGDGGNVNNIFSNNIFYSTQANTSIVSTQSGVWFLNNNYYNSAGGFNVNISGNVFTSLASLRASNWSETWNGNSYGYNVNPSLNSPSSAGTVGNLYPNTLSNFKLNSGSPMINTDFNLATWSWNAGSYDFNGLGIPNGGAYDIGASEYH
ncbi:hypothetical protein [Mucilaginibacter ginsenosidivorax]|uniref:Right-handed parallel beta-helix repeat-containing protein n=1 Tax=Mucilaginibacter ginsenosidivorax TaxID=862126 RepID=A0A5B8W624_9SPHI|nr:hypothetical protein [Mucilaginibacter ginsenosidivorax]QEC78897.1 hypothetical protein FSB76_24195 [Mucilaginibacter ginsenosidivorax]